MTDDYLPHATPITIPEAEENLEIIRMVHEDPYPPTNPAVLLRAARWAYLDGNVHHGRIIRVLEWTAHVMRANS